MGDTRTPSLNEGDFRSEEPSAAWWRGSVIVGIALAMSLGGLVLLWLLARPLTLALIAIIVAQALAPVVTWLERWLSRGIAVVLVYLSLLLVAGGIGWLVIPPLVDEARTLVMEAPALVSQSRRWLSDLDQESADRVIAAAQSAHDRFSDGLLSLPFTLFSSAIDFTLVVFMSVYWLLATPALSQFGLSLIPSQHRRRANDVIDAMGQTMGGYVRATVINGLIIGVLTFAGLFVIGVQYLLVLAVIAGLGEFLPVIGPILAAIPAIAALESPRQAVIVAIFYLLLQQLEANLLVPFIMRTQADVPPLLSLFALLVGSTLGGILGAVVAIPLAGALRVLVIRVFASAEREWSGVDEQSDGPQRRRARVPAAEEGNRQA